jgi:MOSC domain-containing protein YiiM
MTGRLLQLSIKPETPGEFGLPKSAVPELMVTPAGAEGDYNRYRTEQLAGDRDQALLIMTGDLLDRLGSEGWPVGPGDFGENLTLGDIPESALAPGVRLRLGEVEIEVTKACVPCTELYSLPHIGQERGPAFVRALVGRRGWYARVLTGGRLDLETPVELVRDGVIIPDAR